MKNKAFALSALSLISFVSSNFSAQPVENKAAPWHAAARGAHHTEWTSVTMVTNPVTRKVRAHSHKFVELGAGLNYPDGAGGFLPSSPEFTITEKGAEVGRSQHRVALAADINTLGAIEIVTPDGLKLRSNPVGIGYFDPVDGRSILLASLISSIGWLTASNEVTYSNCFSHIRASVRYRNSLAGIEQDLLLHERPAPPSAFGLSQFTRLELFTEFAGNTPEPLATNRVLRAEENPANRRVMVEPDFIDNSLTFGNMTMGAGKAFVIDASSQSSSVGDDAPVAKQFTLIDGKKVLIESVEYNSLQPLLILLPPANSSGISTNASLKNSLRDRHDQAGIRSLPAQRFVEPTTNRIQLVAKIDASRETLLARIPVVVIDYDSLNNSSATDKTFYSDITYLVTGTYTLSGTTTFEGGTVVKYNLGAKLNVNGPIVSKTSAYRPAVFTAVDDRTVGETIPGSNSTPSGYYANPALNLANSQPASWTMSNFRIRYAQQAISASSISFSLDLSHGQIVNSSSGIYVPGQGEVYLRNLLFEDVQTALINPSYVNFHVENTTFTLGGANFPMTPAFLSQSSGTAPFNIDLKNCVLANLSASFISGGSGGTLTGDHNGFYNSPPSIGTFPITTTANPFQTIGGGKAYLAANSVFRNFGTLSITPSLLTALRELTTDAPIFFSMLLRTPRTLGQDVSRDVDALDLGHHFPAVDYLVSGLEVLSSTLTLTNGLTVAFDYNAAAYGIKLSAGHIVSTGDPKKMNRLVSANAVQEAPFVASATYQYMLADAPIDVVYPDARFRFTEFSQMSAGSYYYYGNYLTWFELKDCQLLGGTIYGYFYNPWGYGVAWYNNLFEKVKITAGNGALINFNAFNNTFVGGSLSLQLGATAQWTLRDNIFDSILLTDNGSAVANSHNAYRNVTGSGLQGASSTFPMTDTYQIGLLGNYYLPVGSALRNVGSRTVALAGLYHYTTFVAQTKEGTTGLDLGFHFVGLDTSQNNTPFDNDGDTLTDVQEDTNGNGLLDQGESNWQSSINGLTAASTLDVFTPLK